MNNPFCAWIIPALAGNTRGVRKASSPGSDHPRSRGEYTRWWGSGLLGTGSSPLSRGIHTDSSPDLSTRRIIPALAGNTLLVKPKWTFRIGSSPLSRGIPQRFRRWSCGCGIIPALAGNTGLTMAGIRWVSDHPRSRGEYPFSVWGYTTKGGSSPLSRGIQAGAADECARGGIIPALAGNTWSPLDVAGGDADHPRSRGEYMILKSRSYSSMRIIPALAGNTLHRTQPAGQRLDHPRSRGEYMGGAGMSQREWGSSPLSRGIPTHVETGPRRMGIIPALAGNTQTA